MLFPFMVIATLAVCEAQAAEWPDISTPPAGNSAGKVDTAVIVGIEDYTYVAGIAGARQNAEDWYRYLTKSRGIPASRVTLLRNIEGTDAQVRAALTRAVEQVGPSGMLWFIYIGHGAPSKDGQDGLLVGVDAQQSAIGIYSRSVPRSELLATIEKGRQAHAVVVLDTCFSGRSSSGQALVSDLQPLVPSYAFHSSASRLAMLTATRAGQFAGPLPGVRRPAFSYLVLGALRGWGDRDENGQVTAEEAGLYAREALEATVRDRQQGPEVSGQDVGVVIGWGRERGPDLAELALAMPPPSPAPTSKVAVANIGTDADLLADVDVIAAQLEAAERIKQRLATTREKALDEATTALQAQAAETWTLLGRLRELGGEPAREKAPLHPHLMSQSTA
ncbi:MAG: hypothetical protein HN348_06710 [Proteobacteria bacterium]|jgi:hypothetical protein|nr:hypothetical protein [Pseudomonadota bacterium]